MSTALYSTGLWWYGGAKPWGLAKLHGRERRLDTAPLLLGLTVVLIEYAPEVGLRNIKPAVGDPRRMSNEETRAADAYLRLMLPEAET